MPYISERTLFELFENDSMTYVSRKLSTDFLHLDVAWQPSTLKFRLIVAACTGDSYKKSTVFSFFLSRLIIDRVSA